MVLANAAEMADPSDQGRIVLLIRASVACVLILLASEASAARLGPLDVRAIRSLEREVAAMPGRQATNGPATLAARMAEARVPAVGIAFIEDGEIKWARTYGISSARTKRAADSQTLFQAASLSKAVTAAAALRLADAGLLSIDADVTPKLPEWTLAGRTNTAMSLRQLLSHRAGLTVSFYPGYRAGAPLPTLLQSLTGTPPADATPVRAFAPAGTQTAYSGGGYSVAQLFLTKATRLPFADLMSRHLLRPANMARSTFRPVLPATDRNHAAGHDEAGQPIAGDAHIYPELAAAGLWTTPSDYAHFIIALQDSWRGKSGALLRPASVRAMMTPIDANYGLGVMSATAGGRQFFTHGGSNEGFECRFTAFLDGSRQGMVIMTNGAGGGRLAAAVQRTLARAYGWPDVQLPPVPRAPDD